MNGLFVVLPNNFSTGPTPVHMYMLQDFMTAPIISEDVFNMMDKNKDGFVSKGNIEFW